MKKNTSIANQKLKTMKSNYSKLLLLALLAIFTLGSCEKDDTIPIRLLLS
jgi:hypothetical protein